MKNGAICRPLSRALIMCAALEPAVSLRCTAGFILARLRRSSLTRTIAVQRRRRVESKPLISWGGYRFILFGSVTERRRRVGLKPGVQRSGTPGEQGIKYSEPLTRGGGERLLTDTIHHTANHAPAGSP
jgi:hypothetical protein